MPGSSGDGFETLLAELRQLAAGEIPEALAKIRDQRPALLDELVAALRRSAATPHGGEGASDAATVLVSTGGASEETVGVSSGGESSATVGVATEGSADRLGPYRLVRELGRGGQGVVYLAEDPRLRRRVALKVLHGLGGISESARKRFAREAEAASRLDHPGICTVHDVGSASGVAYIAMRYVEGESIEEKIAAAREAGDARGIEVGHVGEESTATEGGPVTSLAESISRARISRVTLLIEDAARALHAAHESGIVHRDIKPGNIMVSAEGEPVLMDFGLAHLEDSEGPSLTRTGEFFGTPAYMSPEQVTGDVVHLDRRTDVWSLGATLYESLCLQRPFQAVTREALYQEIVGRDPPDIRALNPSVPDDLRVVVETALEKNLDRRYQTALDLAEDLGRFRRHEPIHARPATTWLRLRRWAERHPGVAASLAALLVTLGAGLVVSLVLLRQRETALDEKSAALRRYDQMSDVALVEELQAEAARLWPRRPHLVPAMKGWLRRARELHERLSLHEAALEELRGRAQPYDDAQREDDVTALRQLHPDLDQAIEDRERQVSGSTAVVGELHVQIEKLDTAIEGAENDRVLARLEARHERLTQRLHKVQDEIAARRQELETLERDPRLARRLTFRLADAGDRWRHQVLAGMVDQLRPFATLIADVEERLIFAETLPTRSVEDHRAAWERCLADLRANPKYAGCSELAVLEPRIGLAPLGIDRDSGLWEFWHLGSGERPGWDGAPWEAAADADPQGNVRLSESSGIVLILVPGDSFWMGATPQAGERQHDPQAVAWESPVHEVTLESFFIAKHELTQAQWTRLMGSNPSRFRPGLELSEDMQRVIAPATLLHPITNLTWDQCREALRRWGLELPTEAAWECSCRAGTGSVFWCGDSVRSIQDRRAGNIADVTADRLTGSEWSCSTEVDDGYPQHSPVGAFAPNAFGLHDVIGNVSEWCRDHYVPYRIPPRPGDGLRAGAGRRDRIVRGGNYHEDATGSRSSSRLFFAPSVSADPLGCRAALGVRDR